MDNAFFKADALVNQFWEYELSECFTLENYGSNIPEGVVGMCARKLLMAVNHSMIVKGILPFDPSYSYSDEIFPATEDICKMNSCMNMDQLMHCQVYGVMSALGWEISEYDCTIESYTYGEQEEIDALYRNIFLEDGMNAQVCKELERLGVFEFLDMYTSCGCEGKLTLYTNKLLSAHLQKTKSENEVYNLSQFFNNINIYNLSSVSSFWVGDDYYFLNVAHMVFAEETATYVDIGDYYLDLSAPYRAVVLDRLLRNKQ